MHTEMRWVFVRPRNKSPYYDPEIQEPLGLQYLSASRRAKGENVLILDCSLNSISEQKLARRAAAFRPDVIGFSIMTAQEVESVRAIYDETIKALNGQSVLWLAGGNFISTESPMALNVLPSDILPAKYEGERILDLICRAYTEDNLNKYKDPASGAPIPIYADSFINDLDGLHFPDRPFADLIVESGWAFNIQGSRGCCGTCNYCSSPGMAPKGLNPWRGRSPENIVEEIANLNISYGAYSFNFVDEDFLGVGKLAIQRAEEFVANLNKRKLHISFGIQVRPQTLDEHVIELLAENGLTYVFLGIESDSPEDFKRWGRQWIHDPWRLVKKLQEYDIGVNAGIMLFHSHATLKSIRQFAVKLHSHGLLEHRAATNRQDALPGSIFFKKSIKSGLFPPDVCGPQPIPFINSEVESLYRDVKAAINPLGPTSMHAICMLPPLLAQRHLNNRFQSKLDTLRTILQYHDNAVAQSFFALLDFHEKDIGSKGLVKELQKKNLDIALRGASDLLNNGFASSYDELREAIKQDADI